MKILALEKEIRGSTDENFTAAILKEEALQVWNLHQTGIIRELYFREDQHKAVLILECKDTGEAHAVLSTLPLVKSRLIAFDVIPLIAYDGFRRIFTKET